MPAGKTPSPSLRRSAAHGAKWTGAAALVTVTAQLVQLAVLARLLTPADYGLAAVAIAILGFGTALTDGGVSSAIIARQTTSLEVLSSLYWTNAFTGILAFGLAAAVTPLLAELFGQPELASLLLLGAVMFLIAPVGQQFRVLLQRDLRFRALGMIDVVAAFAGTTSAIAAAAFGAGAASLVIGMLALNATRSLVAGIYGWVVAPFMLRFRWSEVHDYLGFGVYMLGQRLCSQAAYNIDYLIIGAVLGPVALAPYTIAFQLVVRPQVQLSPVLNRVAFPVFARRQQDDAALRRGFTELSQLIALASFPALVGLAAVAPNFIPVALGPKWTDAIPLVQILAVLGAMRALWQPTASLLLAKNRPAAAFGATVVSLLSVGTGVFVGVQFGIITASWAHVIAVTLVFVFQLLAIHRVIHLAPRTYLQTLARPAAMSITMGAIVVCVGLVLDLAGGSAGVTLIGQIAAGTVVYLLLLSRLYSSYGSDLRGLLRTRGST